MTREVLYAGAGAVAIIALYVIPDEWTEVRDILVGVLGGVALFALDRTVANWRYLRLWFSTLKVRTQTVRVSASYLYRIKVDNDYLLVRGQRIRDQFQPVGGVYKRYPDSTGILAKLGVQDDQSIPIDDSNREDLRIRVPARKLMGFVRWYQAREGREVETWREFCEEMVTPGLLPSNVFPHLHVRHVGQRFEGVRWSVHFQTMELLIADIVEVLWTPAQLDALRERRSAAHHDLMWASERQIRARGYDSDTGTLIRISPTAEWTL